MSTSMRACSGPGTLAPVPQRLGCDGATSSRSAAFRVPPAISVTNLVRSLRCQVLPDKEVAASVARALWVLPLLPLAFTPPPGRTVAALELLALSLPEVATLAATGLRAVFLTGWVLLFLRVMLNYTAQRFLLREVG